MWIMLILLAGYLIWCCLKTPSQRPLIAPIQLHAKNRLLPDIFQAYTIRLVGEEYYQQPLKLIAGDKQFLPKHFKTYGILCREPYNAHNQYTVVLYVQGYKVGRLSLDAGHAFCLWMQRQEFTAETCFAVECLICGGYRKHGRESRYMVQLNLPPSFTTLKYAQVA